MNLLQSLRKAFRFIGIFVLISCTSLCVYSPSLYAQEGQAIGRVLSTSGSVTARDLNGALRELRRRSDIFVGDTVITGSDGFAQLRMVDSAQISFKEDTEFTFSEYSSDGPGGAPDSALMELVRGGFRTISGTISDDDADEYEISTQFASIGIRGTTHEGVIDAGSLLTGVYDGGTTISNAQGSLDTGEGANFNYSQTFPGQAPRGLLQQPAQLGNINLNGAGNDGDDDDGDDGEDGDGNDNGDQDGDGNDDADDGDDGNQDGQDGDNADDNTGDDGDDNNETAGNDDGDNQGGGIADANDEEAGARDTGAQPTNPANNPGNGVASNNTDVDPAADDTRTTEQNINPVIDVREADEFEETGTGTIASNTTEPDPEPTTDPEPATDPDPVVVDPEPEFIQPTETFLSLVSNSGFNTDFSLSELQGITGQASEVLAFDGLADVGGLSAAAVGDNGATTSITSLTMTFDLDFSASLGQVSNGFLGINLDDAPTPIVYNIYFDGSIINSQSDFTIGSSSNRVQGSQTTSINLLTSFLDSILVDDGSEQALFSDFFFEDTQGLGVEGQALVGIAPPSNSDPVIEVPEVTPVLDPADIANASEDIGFILSRFASPGAIFPGNISDLVPGEEVILISNDLTSPRTVDETPEYVFRGDGAFLDFTDGTIVDLNVNENPYDFEIAVWGSAAYPVSLFTDYTDDSVVSFIEVPMVAVSIDPAPLASLTGTGFYMTNLDRTLSGSNQGSVSEFFTYFNVDFTASLIDGAMEFCINGCVGENSQFWSFDYSGAVLEGYVVAAPTENTGYINDQLASIFGLIEGAFTGDNAEAFVGGFNLYYDPELDIYLDGEASLPETLVDGVFLVEEETRASSDELLSLDYDSFLVQEGYARIFLGQSRMTSSDNINYDIPILFRDDRSTPRLILRDDSSSVTISRINENLSMADSSVFGVDWERWDGPVLAYSDNLDNSVLLEDAAGDAIHDVAFFSTFNISEMQDISGRYETVLGFIGEGDAGTAISNLEMRFDINFSAASSMNNIENGKILIDVGSGQSWLAFFEGGLSQNRVEFDILGTNPFDNSEQSGIYNGSWTFINAIDTDDSRMQGAIVDNGTTPALLSSFYFREQAPYTVSGLREGVMGLGLVSLTPDLRFDNSTEGTGGILQSDLDNLGLVILSNPANVTTNVVDGVVQDYIIPVFGSDTTSISDRPVFGQFTPTNGSNPYYLSLERVIVNQNNSTSADRYFTGVSSYNIDWGIWNSPGNSNNGLFAFTDSQDTGINENAFKAMPWLLVNDPQISSYKGTATTYSNVIAFLDEGDDIGSIFTAFDVDFDSALVDDGFIQVCMYSSTCSSGSIWTAYFDATISGGYLNSTYLSGSIDNTYPFSGEIAGAFASPNNDDSTQPYNAFAGGFNFVKDANSSVYLSGLFLAERESRLLAYEIQEMQHHTAIVLQGASLDGSNNLIPGSISFGSATHPWEGGGSSSTVSPKIGINDRGSQVFGSIDQSQPFDEVITGNSDISSISNTYISNIEVSPGGFDVDWGFWDSSSMSIMHNQFDDADTTAPDADILWANIVPSDALEIASRTGSYTYYGVYEFAGTSSNGILEHLSMYFNVDFADSTPIGTGYLEAGDGELYWEVDITGGTINGAFVQFDTALGDLSNWDATVITPCTACVVADIQGVFTGSETYDMYANPVEAGGFAAAFLLNNSLDPNNPIEFIQGLGILESGSAEY